MSYIINPLPGREGWRAELASVAQNHFLIPWEGERREGVVGIKIEHNYLLSPVWGGRESSSTRVLLCIVKLQA